MCRGLNVKTTYLEACGDEGNVVVGGRKIGFIDLRWSETKLREGVGGRNASKNAVARFDLPASLIPLRKGAAVIPSHISVPAGTGTSLAACGTS